MLEAVPDARLDEISASVDKKLDFLSEKVPFVINNHSEADLLLLHRF